MDAQFLVAMAIALPVIMLPVAFVWYLNIGGMLKVMRKAAGEHPHADGAVVGRGQ